MKKRLLFYEIKKQIFHKNALVITGMRQVGKTTLMRQLYDEFTDIPKLWFDLDNPLDQKIFESVDYNGLYARLTTLAGSKGEKLLVCIDEIQNLPDITKVIKFLIDHFGVKFIVTGSSNFYLKHLFPESLAGRKFLYELQPMRFLEFLYFKDHLSLAEAEIPELTQNIQSVNEIEHYRREAFYEEYLGFGGFPEVVVTPDIKTKQLVLKHIFTSFFEKDLQILSDYKDIRQLRDFILLLVPRVGSMLDVSKLAGELGVERAKIYGYLEFLQGTFFIRLVPKFSQSVDRTVAGGKKLYFNDVGILNSIGAVNRGQLLENAVANQLSAYGPCSFYNKRNTAEIDGIVDKKIAIEIKLAGTSADYRKLTKLTQTLGLKQAWVVSLKYSSHSHMVSPVFL